MLFLLSHKIRQNFLFSPSDKNSLYPCTETFFPSPLLYYSLQSHWRWPTFLFGLFQLRWAITKNGNSFIPILFSILLYSLHFTHKLKLHKFLCRPRKRFLSWDGRSIIYGPHHELHHFDYFLLLCYFTNCVLSFLKNGIFIWRLWIIWYTPA